MIPLAGLVAAVVSAAPAAEVRVPKMPLTGLAAAVHVPDLCHYRYPVGTRNADCQRFCDQALGYYYSYVWMEAARSFETALTHDPECAFAWLGLHRGLEKWGKTAAPKPDAFLALTGGAFQPKLPDRFAKPAKDFALDSAKRLMPGATYREQMLITAKLHEKGMMPGTGPDDRRKKAQQTLDELLTLHEDDEEAWFARAQLADGPHGAAPFYKALLKINPIHPGASHEFVHFYENIRRPALGWPYAEAYIASSPGIPHAFHMQAHLGMRVGKWSRTTDWSWRALELEIAYHKVQGVKPEDDHQFVHHMETLTRSLVHDGRFNDAREIRKLADGYKYTFRPEWFRMAVAEKDWPAADTIITQIRKSDKAAAAYYSAIVAVEQGDAARARAEVDSLRQAQQVKKGNRPQELRLWEAQGRLECLTGNGDAGVKLLKRTIDKTKDDYNHHAWGGGAYYMESWGTGALDAGLAAEAEEAFQEALAHDAGSARGALGMWALADRLARTDEADRYLKLARRAWAKADSQAFETLKADMARRAGNIPRPSLTAAK